MAEGKRGKERERERKRERKGKSERAREYPVGSRREENSERMREIRIYTLAQRSMPSMRLVFNALINV